MTYNFWLNGKKIDTAKLDSMGFANSGNEFTHRIDLVNGIYITIKIKTASRVAETVSDPQLFVDVFDSYTNKKCSQFYSGHSGAALKSEVQKKVTDCLQPAILK